MLLRFVSFVWFVLGGWFVVVYLRVVLLGVLFAACLLNCALHVLYLILVTCCCLCLSAVVFLTACWLCVWLFILVIIAVFIVQLRWCCFILLLFRNDLLVILLDIGFDYWLVVCLFIVLDLLFVVLYFLVVVSCCVCVLLIVALFGFAVLRFGLFMLGISYCLVCLLYCGCWIVCGFRLCGFITFCLFCLLGYCLLFVGCWLCVSVELVCWLVVGLVIVVC